MPAKKTLVLLFLVFYVTAFTQSNFSYSPQNPKAGDAITITYEPAGAIAGTLRPIEASYYMLGYGSNSANSIKYINADDLKLTRDGRKFTGTIQTNTAANFIFFGFSSNKQFDNNFNNGYYILLADGEKEKKGAHSALAGFYQYMGRSVGVDPDLEKAFTELEKEITLYPEERKKNLFQYLRFMLNLKKPNAGEIVQKEIESTIKAGLKTEDDYQNVQDFYSLLKLPQQSMMIASVKKEKFPEGKWKIGETVQKMYAEQDPVKYENLLAEVDKNVKIDPAWKYLESTMPFLKQQAVSRYQAKNDWEGMKKALSNLKFERDEDKASFYNNLAWEMQKSSADLKTAEELSRFATQYAKQQMEKPSGEKPPYITSKQWSEQRKSAYAMYADTYGMVLYRMGEFKKGLPYAKDAAIKIREGKSADENNTYALLAEKALPLKQYKKELEQFVKEGKSTSEIKDVLKRAYTKEKGSEEGFSNYIVALEKEAYTKMIEELHKSMLNETTPVFALMDLDGNKVNVADLKGKVVVVDFWATWCGPCKASFPAMQKMVLKYKEDPNVKFVFIDTWENAEEKRKNASEFIDKNKYSFQVLLDNDSKVVEQFKVEGIPTKFVIDKNGIIRFKSIGFDGSDDKLISELTAMIDMAAQQTNGTKTF